MVLKMMALTFDVKSIVLHKELLDYGLEEGIAHEPISVIVNIKLMAKTAHGVKQDIWLVHLFRCGLILGTNLAIFFLTIKQWIFFV